MEQPAAHPDTTDAGRVRLCAAAPDRRSGRIGTVLLIALLLGAFAVATGWVTAFPGGSR